MLVCGQEAGEGLPEQQPPFANHFLEKSENKQNDESEMRVGVVVVGWFKIKSSRC